MFIIEENLLHASRPFLRFYDEYTYWGEKIISLLKHQSFSPIIPLESSTRYSYPLPLD